MLSVAVWVLCQKMIPWWIGACFVISRCCSHCNRKQFWALSHGKIRRKELGRMMWMWMIHSRYVVLDSIIGLINCDYSVGSWIERKHVPTEINFVCTSSYLMYIDCKCMKNNQRWFHIIRMMKYLVRKGLSRRIGVWYSTPILDWFVRGYCNLIDS